MIDVRVREKHEINLRRVDGNFLVLIFIRPLLL